MEGSPTRRDRFSDIPDFRMSRSQFVVENLVKSQVQRMERASREELGHPMLPATSAGSSSRYFDQSSQGSLMYEESLASSSRYGGGRHPPAPVRPPGGRHHPPSSVAASSSYYAPSSLVVPRHREPPAPISPQKMVPSRMSSDRIECKYIIRPTVKIECK